MKIIVCLKKFVELEVNKKFELLQAINNPEDNLSDYRYNKLIDQLSKEVSEQLGNIPCGWEIPYNEDINKQIGYIDSILDSNEIEIIET